MQVMSLFQLLVNIETANLSFKDKIYGKEAARSWQRLKLQKLF